MRSLAGGGFFTQTVVLATEPMIAGLSQVSIHLAESAHIDQWAVRPLAEIGVIMFEPPRLYYGRERALWTPAPEQLPSLAQWLRRCGITTLAVVVPHVLGHLPGAVRHGLANLDEQAIAALGFERLLFVRSAQKAAKAGGRTPPERLAALMLSIFGYMIPANERPVRPARLAEFIDVALQLMPPGIRVASPELLWRAGQGQSRGRSFATASGSSTIRPSMQELVMAWLNAELPYPVHSQI